MSEFLDYYARVTLSLLLIIANAIPIRLTTNAPATKLDIKFANEGVIYKVSFFLIVIKLKIVKLTTIYIVSSFYKK